MEKFFNDNAGAEKISLLEAFKGSLGGLALGRNGVLISSIEENSLQCLRRPKMFGTALRDAHP